MCARVCVPGWVRGKSTWFPLSKSWSRNAACWYWTCVSIYSMEKFPAGICMCGLFGKVPRFRPFRFKDA